MVQVSAMVLAAWELPAVVSSDVVVVGVWLLLFVLVLVEALLLATLLALVLLVLVLWA